MTRQTLLAAAAALALVGPATAGSHLANERTLAQNIQGNEDLSTLASAIEAAGLVDTVFSEPGPMTVFAPSDAAFEALPEGALDELLAEENGERLRDLLLYHVASGALMSGDLSDGQEADTLLGEPVAVSVGDAVTVGEATVTEPDLEASNGVIHVIDAVLMPPGSM